MGAGSTHLLLLRKRRKPRWSPLSLGSSLAAWWDGHLSTKWQEQARTTPAVLDTAVVGALDDLSGNGRHLTNPTSGQCPLLRTEILNGQHVVRFDGVDNRLMTEAFQTFPSKRGTLVMVVKPTGAQDPLLSTYPGTSPDWELFHYTSDPFKPFSFLDGSPLLLETSADVSDWCLLILRRTSDTSVTFRRNGTNRLTVTVPDAQPASNILTMGAESGGAGFFAAMDMAMTLMVNRDVTAAELASIEAYAYSRFGGVVIS